MESSSASHSDGIESISFKVTEESDANQWTLAPRTNQNSFFVHVEEDQQFFKVMSSPSPEAEAVSKIGISKPPFKIKRIDEGLELNTESMPNQHDAAGLFDTHSHETKEFEGAEGVYQENDLALSELDSYYHGENSSKFRVVAEIGQSSRIERGLSGIVMETIPSTRKHSMPDNEIPSELERDLFGEIGNSNNALHDDSKFLDRRPIAASIRINVIDENTNVIEKNFNSQVEAERIKPRRHQWETPNRYVIGSQVQNLDNPEPFDSINDLSELRISGENVKNSLIMKNNKKIGSNAQKISSTISIDAMVDLDINSIMNSVKNSNGERPPASNNFSQHPAPFSANNAVIGEPTKTSSPIDSRASRSHQAEFSRTETERREMPWVVDVSRREIINVSPLSSDSPKNNVAHAGETLGPTRTRLPTTRAIESGNNEEPIQFQVKHDSDGVGIRFQADRKDAVDLLVRHQIELEKDLKNVGISEFNLSFEKNQERKSPNESDEYTDDKQNDLVFVDESAVVISDGIDIRV